MSQLGIGAMIHYPEEYIGRKIIAATMTDERLRLSFADGTVIEIWDNGQSCCESRYMTTDDDVQSLVGHALTRVETKPGPDTEGEYGGCHEQIFVEVGTDAGFITVVNHNEHNGYYGGFGLTITEADASPPRESLG